MAKIQFKVPPRWVYRRNVGPVFEERCLSPHCDDNCFDTEMNGHYSVGWELTNRLAQSRCIPAIPIEDLQNTPIQVKHFSSTTHDRMPRECGFHNRLRFGEPGTFVASI